MAWGCLIDDKERKRNEKKNRCDTRALFKKRRSHEGPLLWNGWPLFLVFVFHYIFVWVLFGEHFVIDGGDKLLFPFLSFSLSSE